MLSAIILIVVTLNKLNVIRSIVIKLNDIILSYSECCYDEYHFAEWQYIMLSVIMPSVVMSCVMAPRI